MRLQSLRRPAAGSGWLGAVLSCDLLGENGRPLLGKGHRLVAEDAALLDGSPGQELHLLWLDEGDVDEDSAAQRLAEAVAGPGVEIHRPVKSQVRLSAAWGGLVRVDAARLAAVNELEGITIFTVADGLPVQRGRTLAGVKVAGLAISGDILAEAERCATRTGSAAPLVAVRPFQPLRVAAVVRQQLAEGPRQRFGTSLRSRVSWFGGSVISVDYPEDRTTAHKRILAAVAAADLVAVVGVATVDPLEETWRDLLDAGAAVVRRGFPVHPGSSYWLLTLADIPVVGVASCGTFARRSALDLLFARFFSGEPLDGRFLAGLGHGGLLQANELSPAPDYDPGPEAEAR